MTKRRNTAPGFNTTDPFILYSEITAVIRSKNCIVLCLLNYLWTALSLSSLELIPRLFNFLSTGYIHMKIYRFVCKLLMLSLKPRNKLSSSFITRSLFRVKGLSGKEKERERGLKMD